MGWHLLEHSKQDVKYSWRCTFGNYVQFLLCYSNSACVVWSLVIDRWHLQEMLPNCIGLIDSFIIKSKQDKAPDTGVHKFYKHIELFKNSTCQEGDTEQDPCWVPTNIRCHNKKKIFAMETWRFGFLHPCYNKGNLKKMYIFLPF
jgi:hypothetical protein